MRKTEASRFLSPVQTETKVRLMLVMPTLSSSLKILCVSELLYRTTACAHGVHHPETTFITTASMLGHCQASFF